MSPDPAHWVSLDGAGLERAVCLLWLRKTSRLFSVASAAQGSEGRAGGGRQQRTCSGQSVGRGLLCLLPLSGARVT